MWASEAEKIEQFHSTTLPIASGADFRIRDIWDNGEFITGATLDYIIDGKVVDSENFAASSEFPNDGTATDLARSAGVSWVEAQEYTLEERLGPYGLEWQREQAERIGA